MGPEAAIFLIGLAIGSLISGVIGLLIGDGKDRAGAGFALGFFLGPLGWVIAALLDPSDEMTARDLSIQQQMMRQAMTPHMQAGW